jgi:hypothetical protein
LASALPAPEQTDKVFAISLPVGNWIFFYSFVIDHEIQFAYERPLGARSGRLAILFGKARTLNRYKRRTRTPAHLLIRKLKPGDIEQPGNSE